MAPSSHRSRDPVLVLPEWGKNPCVGARHEPGEHDAISDAIYDEIRGNMWPDPTFPPQANHTINSSNGCKHTRIPLPSFTFSSSQNLKSHSVLLCSLSGIPFCCLTLQSIFNHGHLSTLDPPLLVLKRSWIVPTATAWPCWIAESHLCSEASHSLGSGAKMVEGPVVTAAHGLLVHARPNLALCRASYLIQIHTQTWAPPPFLREFFAGLGRIYHESLHLSPHRSQLPRICFWAICSFGGPHLARPNPWLDF